MPARDLGADRALDVLELSPFAGCHQGDGTPFPAGAARTADAVNVALRILGDVVVDDVGHVLHVQPPGRHVRRHQQLGLPSPEALHHPVALYLAEVAVERLGRVGAAHQPISQVVHAPLGAAEHDGRRRLLEVQDARQHLELVAPPHLEVDLPNLGHRHGLGPDGDPLRMGQVLVGQLDDGLGQGGREERRLPLGRRGPEDSLDVLDEAHGEHLVGLVQHDHAHAAQLQGAPSDVVQ